jgi:hypothetical protein
MAMTADTEQPVGTTPDNRTHAAPAYRPESPFAEGPAEPGAGAGPRLGAEGFTPWTETYSPFTEAPGAGPSPNAELEALAGDVMEDLYDEAFDQAVAGLVAETAEAVDERLAGEAAAGLVGERLRLGDSHLAPVGFEAEQYLDRLGTGLAGIDVASLTDQQLDELFEQFDEATPAVSPAGEEFIKAIKRKARQAVQAVTKVAKAAAKAAAPLLGPVLARLKRFVWPLLRRVLAMAIGRLPAPLQEPARALARRFGVGEAESGPDAGAEAEAELEGASPVAVGDPEALAEEFDALVAEAVVAGAAGPGLPATEGLGEAEYEDPELEGGQHGGYGHGEGRAEPSPLEVLAEARAALTDALAAAGDGEDPTPAVEQFVPALLPLLRTGIRLVGRPRVVSFLTGAMGGLLSRWVGPQHARPLSAAIVEAGLRLAGLERPEPGAGSGGTAEDEAGPAALAAVVEDTVRRVAELEDEVLEDEAVLPLAVGEAFAEAAGAHLPAGLLRSGLVPAPTLAGLFVPRHPRQAYTYKKYSAVPEVVVTEAVARSVRTFGGATLAAALRASGRTLPLRARVHVYEATVGTSLRKLASLERVPGLGPGRPGAMAQLHPLTPEAAGLLLREPRLGVRIPTPFLQSRYRIAVGQRFYYLAPARGVQASPLGAPGAAATQPSRGTVTVDLPRGEVRAALYFSEAEAQAVAAALARRPEGPALLTPALAAFEDATRSLSRATGQSRVIADPEAGAPSPPGQQRLPPVVLDPFARRLRVWGHTSLARWARRAAPEFGCAAQATGPGVTVVVHLHAVPGLDVLRQTAAGRLAGAGLARATSGAAFRGMPSAAVTVRSGTPGRAGR